MQDGISGTGTTEFEVGGDHQDQLFMVLSHPHRRFTLQYLHTVDTPLSVDELSAELAAWEDQRTDGTESRAERATIKVSLMHNHVPKMVDAEVVDYDATWQTMTLADGADEVHPHLQALTTE